MGGNKKKGETYWNLSVEPEMGGIQGYQAGSTFKLFTLAAALEKGIPINKKFNARSPMDFGGKYVPDLQGPGEGLRPVHGAQLGRAQQDDRHDRGGRVLGQHLLPAAGAGHRDVPGDQDGQEDGRQGRPPDRSAAGGHRRVLPGHARRSPWARSRSARCPWPRRTPRSPPGASTATRSSSPRSPPGPVRTWRSPDADCKRVMDQDVADGVNKILKSVVDKGTGTRAEGLRRGRHRPARPAPSTATRPSGSPATPPRSPAWR